MVMDRSKYDGKLKVMLLDDTYKKLKKDPIAKIEREVAKAQRIKESCPRIGSSFLTPCLHGTPTLWIPQITTKSIANLWSG